MWEKWNGKQVEKEFNKLAGKAVQNAVEVTGEVSDSQVPHDTGELSQSRFIDRDPDNELKTWIGYGGGGNTGLALVPYARKWHETPANFQKGRKSQFLRDPVKQVLPRALMTELKKIGLK